MAWREHRDGTDGGREGRYEKSKFSFIHSTCKGRTREGLYLQMGFENSQITGEMLTQQMPQP